MGKVKGAADATLAGFWFRQPLQAGLVCEAALSFADTETSPCRARLHQARACPLEWARWPSPPPRHPPTTAASSAGSRSAQLITWGSVFYTFALLMEPVERELGLTRAQSSLAFSLALLAEGLMAWPVGRWIDRGHERAVMTGGSLLVAAGLLLHSVVHSAAGFYAVWLLLGAALSATLYTPVFAVVTRRFPNDFRRAIITLTFLGGLASTVFIPLIAWLIAQLGWRHALWVLAALHLLVCAPLHALCCATHRAQRGAPAASAAAPQRRRPLPAQRALPADRRLRPCC